MKLIHAWVRNPDNNFLKGQTKRCALVVLSCENPDACHLFVNDSSCIHQGLDRCPFGKKSCTQGPTKRAAKYYSTISEWKKTHEHLFNALKPFKASERIFYANGKYYLPYAMMAKGLHDGGVLASCWVDEQELNAALLNKLCCARPRSLMGGEITRYQKEVVPKFICDLHAHYPKLFGLLSENQKDRINSISYVGRKATLITCNPGKFVISNKIWQWDGGALIGTSMLFQPVAGDCNILITPKDDAVVEITDNAQVSAKTKFVD